MVGECWGLHMVERKVWNNVKIARMRGKDLWHRHKLASCHPGQAVGIAFLGVSFLI